jgi:hypothetical protein
VSAGTVAVAAEPDDPGGVVDPNDPPTATDTSYAVSANGTLSVPASVGLLANASDPNPSDRLVAFAMTEPAQGQLSLAANGSFVYEPAANASGTDEFSYEVYDGAGGTDTATATIRIRERSEFVVRLEGTNRSTEAGEPVTVSATVENVGGVGGTQTADLRIDADGNGRLEADETRRNRTVTLNASANATVGFENVSTAGLSAGTYTYGVVTGTDAATGTIRVVADGPAAGQVSVEDVTLSPAMVDANATNDHTLTVDVPNVSDDGDTDTLTVTVADGTLDRANVSVVDTDGDAIPVEESDVSDETVTVDLAPDSNATARDLTVTANVTVTTPDVANTTATEVSVEVADSSNGQASAAAVLTVQPVDDRGPSNPVLELVERDGSVDFLEVLGVIEAFNGDGTYTQNGTTVEVGFRDVLGVLQRFNANQ